MLLPRFSAPGNLREMPDAALDAWSDVVSSIFDDVVELFPNFYNPTVLDTPGGTTLPIRWPAFPATLIDQGLSGEAGWAAADDNREMQDEYCEWSVLRDDDGTVVRVTFTSETPSYYEHLLDHDPDLLVRLYADATGRTVRPDDLRDAHGLYDPKNPFNSGTDGTIVHLSQSNNTLGAAVRLAGDATILRERDGRPVTAPRALVLCGQIGVATRHSDPQIASVVNNQVASGFDVTLADPPGLHIDGLVTTGMDTPDGVDAQQFWTVERGEPGHAVRAKFEVPADREYRVGDITIAGQPIRFGAQLADRVRVRLVVMRRPSESTPSREPCAS